MAVRKADKAGSWYQAAPADLRKEVDDCVKRGVRLYGRPAVEPGLKTTAVVVPHAGLFFSGPVAAVAFELLREAWGTIDTFVLFGACHRAFIREPALWTKGAWRTPLGDIAVDDALAKRFVDEGLGRDNPAAHAGDNSLELQTPFIKHMFPEAKILPVAMSFFPNSSQFGEVASRVARDSGRTVVAVASTDLTHYGATFGLTPAGIGDSAIEWTQANDKRFIDTLLRLDLDQIVPQAELEQSACGAGAAAAAAGWAHERGCRKGRLLAATNSYEVYPRGAPDHLVGYASLAYDVAPGQLSAAGKRNAAC